ARFEIVALQKPQEVFVLIEDACDGDAGAQWAGEQRLRPLVLDDSFRVGDWISVRINLGPSQHLVHPIDQAIGYDVLEQLGLVMYLIPPQTHHLDEKQLDKAMTAKDERRQLSSRLRQRDTRVRLVVDEP